MPTRKVVIEGPGSYDRLQLTTVRDPEPATGEVRVKVRHIGVNYADCVIRMGLYESAKKLVGWPITPRFEVAGVADAVGPGVAQAAGIPTVFLTAWLALRELAHVRRGERVLIHSAAGGAAHKVDLPRQFGARHVIDKSATPLWPRAEQLPPGGFDVILDANGVSTLGDSYARLAPLGRLVVYGFHSMMPKVGGRPTTDNKSVLAFNLSFVSTRTDLLVPAMDAILRGFAEGWLRAPPVRCYPLAEVARAHADLESGTTVGKLVLEV